MSYIDKPVSCRDCGGQFIFTAGEQEFYAQKGFTNEPTRCPLGRRARKEGSSLTHLSGGSKCPHDVSGQGVIQAENERVYPMRRDRADRYSQPRSYVGRNGSQHVSQRDRQTYGGPLPVTEVDAVVVRIDPSGRFLFIRTTELGIDAYVHSSVYAHVRPPICEGDAVRVILTATDRGPRAISLAIG